MNEYYMSLKEAFLHGKLKTGAAIAYEPENALESLCFEAFRFEGGEIRLVSTQATRSIIATPYLAVASSERRRFERAAKLYFSNQSIGATGRIANRRDVLELAKSSNGKKVIENNPFIYYDERKCAHFLTDAGVMAPAGCLIVVEFKDLEKVFIDLNTRRLEGLQEI